jgi:predicted XRE-type DNA-binding protein
MSEENESVGSSFDDLLNETGEAAEVNAVALKRVIAWEIKQRMQAERISKSRMAELMRTSRSSLDRLLDPDNTSVTLHTLDNAARVIGRTLRIELV